jgi:hypothetical protein
LAGPHTGETECLVDAEINLGELAVVKVWIDAAGHYKRPEVLGLTVDKKPLWRDEQAGPSTARKIPFWDEHGQAETILLESAGGTEIKLNNFKQAQNSVSVGNSHNDNRTSGERESAE